LGSFLDDPRERWRDVTVETDVAVRMRDGIVLRADIYRPTTHCACPVLLMRTPYDKAQAQNICFAHPTWYARRGFIVVVQDCRGRYRSDGEWYPFRHEQQDSIDTIDWAANIKGSTGQVVMYGFSYSGVVQLLAAVEKPSPLAAIMPAFTSADYSSDWFYRGGAFQLAFAMTWSAHLATDTARRRGDYALEQKISASLRNANVHYWQGPQRNPLVEDDELIPYYYDWLEHDSEDDRYWDEYSAKSRLEDIEIPSLYIAGWYDIFLEGTIDSFLRTSSLPDGNRRDENRLVIGPWHHMPWTQRSGNCDFGDAAKNCADALQARWLDGVLNREEAIPSEPKVAFFVMGANEWQFSESWPPSGVKGRKLYLHSLGRANSLSGNGSLSPAMPADETEDTYTYDPRNPVMSLGGRSGCLEGLTPMGVADQAPQETKNGVLIYTSRPLEEDLTIVGNVQAHIFASSTSSSTDFVARLTDVHPDGRSFNVVDGIIRVGKGQSTHDQLECAEVGPDGIRECLIRLGPTAFRFEKGHSIRLEITSSNFPAYDRNSNSGKPLKEVSQADMKTSRQTVFHSERYPSCVSLPVLGA
jgi:putative CocE/NonD family hydrolase